MAKPRQSASCVAAGATYYRGGLSDYDAGPLSGDSPDGALRGGRPERLVSDGNFLASMVVSQVTGAPGSGNGTHATLACRLDQSPTFNIRP